MSKLNNGIVSKNSIARDWIAMSEYGRVTNTFNKVSSLQSEENFCLAMVLIYN